MKNQRGHISIEIMVAILVSSLSIGAISEALGHAQRQGALLRARSIGIATLSAQIELHTLGISMRMPFLSNIRYCRLHHKESEALWLQWSENTRHEPPPCKTPLDHGNVMLLARSL